MDTQSNPYESPAEVVDGPPSEARRISRAMWVWPILFSVNLVVPLFLGWGVVENEGRLGLLVALILMLGVGWAVGYWRPQTLRLLMAGGVITAISQMFPVLHFFFGIAAMSVAELMGLTNDIYGDGPSLVGALRGFVITLIVGLGMMLVALGFGVLGVTINRQSGLRSSKDAAKK